MRPETFDEIVTCFATTKCLEERLSVAKRLLKYITSSASLPQSKVKMLMSERSMLYDFWELLKPDCIQRRQGIDQSETLYELHCISLQVLLHFNLKNYKILNNNILSFENIHVICDLLMLGTGHSHEACCVRAQEAAWPAKTIEKARDLMCGKVYDALFDELNGVIYDVELLTEDTGENVVDVLSRECDVEVNNLTVNLKSPNNSSEKIKVVHVVNPQFVWVQELSDDMQEIDQDLSEHLASAAQRASEKDTMVIVRTKKISVRGQVLTWTNSSVRVFAIDYGWQIEVPPSNLYKTEDHIFEIPPLAKLCRIVNIVPPCKRTELQIFAIKLLQTVTCCEPFASVLLRSHLEPVFEILKGTRNSRLLCNILLYFSQLCYFPKNRELAGKLMIKPTLSCIKRWFFCTEVLSQGLEIIRNLVSSNEKNREMFIFNGGLEVAFNAYATYGKEDSVHSQVLHVLKFCLEDYEFESNTYQVYSIENMLSSGNPTDDRIAFSHLSSMSQYNIECSNSVSFIENIIKQQDLVVFAREVVSFLNSSEGGTIYIGVTYQGLINGLLMNRARKDEYRTKIDMVISKMVSDYKHTELPNQLVDCTFQSVKNIHKRAMPEDTKMYVIEVFVTPGRTLSRLRDGDSNVFFKRRHGCVVPISANELRQYVATMGTDKNSIPDMAKPDLSAEDHAILKHEDQVEIKSIVSQQSSDLAEFSRPDDRVQTQGPPPLVPISQLKTKDKSAEYL